MALGIISRVKWDLLLWSVDVYFCTCRKVSVVMPVSKAGYYIIIVIDGVTQEAISQKLSCHCHIMLINNILRTLLKCTAFCNTEKQLTIKWMLHVNNFLQIYLLFVINSDNEIVN